MYYYVCRPIDMWDKKSKPTIDIRIVSEPQKLSFVCDVFPEENRCYLNPIEAAKAAIYIQEFTRKEFKDKVSFMVTCDPACIGVAFLLKTKLPYKLLHWADDEYKSLPKCKECREILGGKKYSNKFSYSDVFCSEDCASKDLVSQVERLKDNEETEFDL